MAARRRRGPAARVARRRVVSNDDPATMSGGVSEEPGAVQHVDDDVAELNGELRDVVADLRAAFDRPAAPDVAAWHLARMEAAASAMASTAAPALSRRRVGAAEPSWPRRALVAASALVVGAFGVGGLGMAGALPGPVQDAVADVGDRLGLDMPHPDDAEVPPAAEPEQRDTTVDAPGAEGATPGQAGTAPGQAGATPGQAGATPADGAEPPGQAGATPGQSGTAPGQSGQSPPVTAPGQSGQSPPVTAPGQSEQSPPVTAPGRSGDPSATAPTPPSTPTTPDPSSQGRGNQP